MERHRPLALARWLLSVAVLVVVIVAVGGITRLTESGLSITEWKPVTGILPPLNEEQWEAEFAAYRQIPQYINVTGPAGMTMAEYKFIYFWEWFHRALGRLIGIAFALPLVWFWIRGAIPSAYKLPLVGLLVLGGLQGAFGWFMVQSGLSGELTTVSHFWLSIHLLTALLTLALLVWIALDLLGLAKRKADGPVRAAASVDEAAQPRARLTGFALVAGLILFIQLLLGAWVAGLSAGYASDTWPLMQERLVPEFNQSRGLFWAMTHDPFLLHFLHRWWAWAAFAALLVMAVRVRRRGGAEARRASIALHSTLGVQVLLGIATVLTGVALWVAVAHQLVGALLVAATAWAAHILGRRPE